jgi:hypothetical protein
MAGVKHDQVDKLADLERAPHTKVVVHVDLTDRHPFKVCADSVHLPLVDRDTSVPQERVFSVVKLRSTISVGVIRNLMVIPDRDPRELLVTGEQVQVRTVGSKSLAVVVQTVDLLVRLWNATDRVSPAVVAVLVLINVVTKMNNVVDGVLCIFYWHFSRDQRVREN